MWAFAWYIMVQICNGRLRSELQKQSYNIIVANWAALQDILDASSAGISHPNQLGEPR
jgi:hypothetical protein